MLLPTNRHLWIGLGPIGRSLDRSQAGLFRYHNGHLVTLDPARELGVTAHVRDVALENSGNVLVILAGGIVCRFQNDRFEQVPELQPLIGKELWKLSVDSKGPSGWILSDWGAYRYQNGKLTAFGLDQGLDGETVARAVRDRNGVIWIGTSLGLARIVDSSCTLFHPDAKDMPHDAQSIYEDREGNLWVGTFGRGLHRLADGSFTTFGAEEGLPSAANTVCEDLDHNFWIGADDGVYWGHDRFVQKYAGPGELNGKAAVLRFLADPRDRSLWITTSRGLFHRTGTEFLQYTMKDGLPSNAVIDLQLSTTKVFSGFLPWKG